MSRVAIIGSCITRDIWPILGEQVSDLLYISRTSLPSLFSSAVRNIDIQAEPPPPLKRHTHNALVADLTKGALSALAAHRPSHIIFDFIDERFDLLAVGDHIVTHSWELEVSGYLDDPALRVRRKTPRLSNACDLLWRDALEELASLLVSTPLRDARLILHEAQWAETHLTGSGRRAPLPDALELMPDLPASRAAHNALLARYQAAFRARLPQAHAVAAPAGLRIADAGHRWGLSPFHYVEGYYDEIRRQLGELGV